MAIVIGHFLFHYPCDPDRLRIVEERHESEIHVQLLMTVEERQTRIVGNKVKFEFLESAQHHHVLDHARGRLAADAGQFEAVPVQMQRVNVITGIAEFQPVASPSCSVYVGFMVSIEKASPLMVH